MEVGAFIILCLALYITDNNEQLSTFLLSEVKN